MKPRLVIMLKEPVTGRVKTRLGRDIGMTASAWWFRHQSAALIRRLRSQRWETRLAVAPDTALHSRFWPANLPRMAQGRGDLGARMKRVLQSSRGPVVLIGGDIPGVQPAHISRAFAQLGAHDMVFGPAVDGGFWLAGVKGRQAVPHNLFKGVRWSSPYALGDTLRDLNMQRVAMVDQLRDVDSASDLMLLRSSGCAALFR